MIIFIMNSVRLDEVHTNHARRRRVSIVVIGSRIQHGLHTVVFIAEDVLSTLVSLHIGKQNYMSATEVTD